MQDVKALPRVHLFVCANRREADAPLGPGCAERGDAVYDVMKEAVAVRGLVRAVWVTKTHCLGICPKRGATVAVYPRQRIRMGVEIGDVDTVISEALGVEAGA